MRRDQWVPPPNVGYEVKPRYGSGTERPWWSRALLSLTVQMMTRPLVR